MSRRSRPGDMLIPAAPKSQKSIDKDRRREGAVLASSVARYHLEEAFWCHHVLDLRRRMRVAVEAIFRHVFWVREGDPEGKDLSTLTEALQTRGGVRMEVIEYANHLRRFGNEAAHARDDEPLRQRMEDNEVEEALYRLRDITTWYFSTFLAGEPVPPSIEASIAFFDPKDVVAGRITDDQRFRHDRRLFELQGKYRLEHLEGVGTTAVVYKVFDMLLERHRALKVQKLELKQSEKVLEGIRKEAKLLSDTTHARLVAVSSVDRLPDGRIFFEMPFLSGGSAASRLAHAHTVDQSAALTWSTDLMEALAFLHERELVHRDIKPENLLIDETERAQLADFGLARTLDGNEFIRTQTVAGTVRYLAPEVQRGGRVGPAADVYSASIVICELFGGSLESDDLGEDLPAPLTRMLAQMSAQNPKQRLTAHQAVQQLRSWGATLRRQSSAPPAEPAPATVRQAVPEDFDGDDTVPRRSVPSLAIDWAASRRARPSDINGLLLAVPPVETRTLLPTERDSALLSGEQLIERAWRNPEDVIKICDALLADGEDAAVSEARARALCALAERQPSKRVELAERALTDATEALFFRPSPRIHSVRARAHELRGADRSEVWRERETALVTGYRDIELLQELLETEANRGDGSTFVGIGLLAMIVGANLDGWTPASAIAEARMNALAAYRHGEAREASRILDTVDGPIDPPVALLHALVALGCHRTQPRGFTMGKPAVQAHSVRAHAFAATALQGAAWVCDLGGVIAAVIPAAVRGAHVVSAPAPVVLADLTAADLERLFVPTLDMEVSLVSDD